jgi:hypothetical protein
MGNKKRYTKYWWKTSAKQAIRERERERERERRGVEQTTVQ